MPSTRPNSNMEKPVPIEWHDSAWLPRVIVRARWGAGAGQNQCQTGAARPQDAGGPAEAPVRLPQLRFSPQAVYGLAQARNKTYPRSQDRPGVAGAAPRITYHSRRFNSL